MNVSNKPCHFPKTKINVYCTRSEKFA